MRSERISSDLIEELDRINILHWGHLFFFLLATFLEFSRGELLWFAPFKFIFIGAYYYYFGKTKDNLYYSFWTFSFILAFYFMVRMFQLPFGSEIFIFYTLALTILAIEMYMLNSPIYYPIISWWEYDFRYRDDLKIKVKLNKSTHDGRLTDVRRGAGCVVSFEKIPLGKKLNIMPTEKWETFNLQCIVMSIRQYSLGRPYQYGVRFCSDSTEEHNLFTEFWHLWRKEKRNKNKAPKKFTHKK